MIEFDFQDIFLLLASSTHYYGTYRIHRLYDSTNHICNSIISLAQLVRCLLDIAEFDIIGLCYSADQRCYL